MLHVDDDPSFLRLTGKMLEQENDLFDIVQKTDVAGALDCLTGEVPDIDCIVSDYAVPRTNGIEFLETVRKRYPHLPFILFTGRGSESVASEALTAGATGYLQKQSGTEQYELLSNRVENAVEQYWSQLEYEVSERYRQELYHVTTDPSLGTAEKTEQLLELGCERLGVENGHVVEIDLEANRHAVTTAAGSDVVEADTVTDLDDTYCRETVSSGNITTVYNTAEWDDDETHQRWGIGCYIGGKIEVDGELYGTVCFVDAEPRERAFTEAERTFVDLLARWLSRMFERQAHERELEAYESLIQRLPIGYVRTTAEGELLTVNPAFVAMVDGESEAAVLNRGVDGLYRDPAAHGQLVNRLRQNGGVADYEVELTTFAGDPVRVTLNSRLVERAGTGYVDALVQERT